jgi:hypothetical protein
VTMFDRADDVGSSVSFILDLSTVLTSMEAEDEGTASISGITRLLG